MAVVWGVLSDSLLGDQRLKGVKKKSLTVASFVSFQVISPSRGGFFGGHFGAVGKEEEKMATAYVLFRAVADFLGSLIAFMKNRRNPDFI